MAQKKIRIAVDAMGGDNAPKEIIKGACLATNKNLKIILVGQKEIIERELNNHKKKNIEILDAREIVTNEDSPAFVHKDKKDSSLIKSLELVKNCEADGAVSAGNTGALLTAAILLLKRVSGIRRPALATPLPTSSGISLLLDSGANVDCKSLYLWQFAHMGVAYVENVMQIKNPRVALLNIGGERGKGNSLTKDAYELLVGSRINFIGNIEARDILSGFADVIICDGFDGNIILKYTEGFSKHIMGLLKQELNKNFLRKLGALLIKPAFLNLKKRFDYSRIGGAPLLGLDSIVVKAHGSSNHIAIKNAIGQCESFIKNDVAGKLSNLLSLTDDT